MMLATVGTHSPDFGQRASHASRGAYGQPRHFRRRRTARPNGRKHIFLGKRRSGGCAAGNAKLGTREWSMIVTVVVLASAGIGAAFVSDWFVEALQPAMKTLGISEAFAGLVVVAVAGNAIENLVGIQLAWRNQADYAVSVILNSSLQIAFGLFPLLVLLSFVLGGAILTFVLSPAASAALALAVIVSASSFTTANRSGSKAWR